MSPFIAHLVGDFLIQNDWMAVNKARSSVACAVHVLVYMAPFLLCNLEWWQLLLIATQHFLQDRTRWVAWWMTRWKQAKKGYPSELSLCVDQSFHLLTIELVILLGQHLGR